MSSSEATVSTVYHGRVKWFNNKAGYGFITIIDDPTDSSKVGLDIFSHHSAISVTSEQYKYLVQGEFVEFNLSSIENSTNLDRKVQASSIRGIKGGKLLCETRNENRTLNPRSRPRSQQQGTQFRGRNSRLTQDIEQSVNTTQSNRNGETSASQQENA
jgi:cold shock CspA family protein